MGKEMGSMGGNKDTMGGMGGQQGNKQEMMREMQEKLILIMSGLPGKMAKAVTQACSERKLQVADFGLTGQGCKEEMDMPTVGRMRMIDATSSDAKERMRKELSNLPKDRIPIVLDFTCTSAVNQNADFYNSLELPFVMGTAGGDRERMMSSTRESNNFAVICDNLNPHVAIFQAMFCEMADRFPGSFSGFNLTCCESQQESKNEISDTCRSMMKYMSKMTGSEMSPNSVKKCRGEKDSKASGVKEEFLHAHQYHSYMLESSDKSVMFEFKSAVNGRECCAKGAVDAAMYLGRQIQMKHKPCVCTMTEVVKEECGCC